MLRLSIFKAFIQRHVVFISPAVALICVATAVYSFKLLHEFETTPGNQGQITNAWPSSNHMILDNTHATLIMFAHPRCTCSKASLQTLMRIVKESKSNSASKIFFYVPKNAEAQWKENENWKIAESIPGVKVEEDLDGAIAAEFGAKTSGHTFLYSPQGSLIFSGGLTDTRGAAGNSKGRQIILDYLVNQKHQENRIPVFGCEI